MQSKRHIPAHQSINPNPLLPPSFAKTYPKKQRITSTFQVLRLLCFWRGLSELLLCQLREQNTACTKEARTDAQGMSMFQIKMRHGTL
jgi:hypothetical protein